MKAKEMFEELGYDLIAETYIVQYYNQEEDNEFCFNKEHKWVEVPKGVYDVIDLKILKAINKQCEELGWLKDSDIK